MLLAHLEGDGETLARLVAQAELWENPYLVARGRAFQAELTGDASLVEGQEGFLPRLTLALLKGEARLLPPYPEEREERLYWHAARYRLLGEEKDLEALLTLTNAGKRILPGLIPLHLLPRSRPELSVAYPLAEVLRSGWKEAILLRHAEIPPVRVEVLGRFRIEGPLGPVELKGKAKEVFALLLLGLPREEVAFVLWPDLSEEAALNNLYVWLARLRKALEPWGCPPTSRRRASPGWKRTSSPWKGRWKRKGLRRPCASTKNPSSPAWTTPSWTGSGKRCSIGCGPFSSKGASPLTWSASWSWTPWTRRPLSPWWKPASEGGRRPGP